MIQKSTSRHLDQFIVRLPEGMRERITQIAKSNNRSMNSEIVAILEKSFRPQISDRLNFLMSEINNSRWIGEVTPSKIAELVGESNADSIEQAFAGKFSLPFGILDLIANLWGARTEWLKHGTGSPFTVEYQHTFSTTDAHHFLESDSKRVAFVRATDSNGNLAVIIERGEGIYDLINTPLHISENIGATGEDANARFSNAIRLLWQRDKSRMVGYLVRPDIYRELVSGNRYPGALLRGQPTSNWIEDWWDESQFKRQSSDFYWHGYQSFCERIHKGIDYSETLQSEKDSIVEGNWVFEGK